MRLINPPGDPEQGWALWGFEALSQKRKTMKIKENKNQPKASYFSRLYLYKLILWDGKETLLSGRATGSIHFSEITKCLLLKPSLGSRNRSPSWSPSDWPWELTQRLWEGSEPTEEGSWLSGDVAQGARKDNGLNKSSSSGYSPQVGTPWCERTQRFRRLEMRHRPLYDHYGY